MKTSNLGRGTIYAVGGASSVCWRDWISRVEPEQDIVILAHASKEWKASIEVELAELNMLGIKERRVITNRPGQKFLLPKDNVGLVYMLGGDARRLMAYFKECPEALHAVLEYVQNGGTLGLTSASAQAVGRIMPTGGCAPRIEKDAVFFGPGMNFVDVIVEVHFNERNDRLFRLTTGAAIFAPRPCFGLSLDTGLIIKQNERGEVWGEVVGQGNVIVTRAASSLKTTLPRLDVSQVLSIDWVKVLADEAAAEPGICSNPAQHSETVTDLQAHILGKGSRVNLDNLQIQIDASYVTSE
jgi:cyanophycinase-like exopeptidase